MIASALATQPNPIVLLRDAGPADCVAVWEWNFAPDVRARSVDQRPVTFAQHAKWYADRIADCDAPIWIIEADGRSVGVVRLDWRSDGAGRISIALAPDARGRGLGRLAITLACQQWGRPVLAEIHPANLASRACFTACGFRPLPHAARDPLLVYVWKP